jgi:uncharacterized RDD family membrane protein YckC
MICPHCAFPNEPQSRVCKKCHRPIDPRATDALRPVSPGNKEEDETEASDWMKAPGVGDPKTEPSPRTSPPPLPKAAPAQVSGDQAVAPENLTDPDSEESLVATCLQKAGKKEEAGDLRGAFLTCQSLLIDRYGEIPDVPLASLYSYMAKISQMQGKEERAEKYFKKASVLGATSGLEEPEEMPTPSELPVAAPVETVAKPIKTQNAAPSSIEKALTRAVQADANAEIIQEPQPADADQSTPEPGIPLMQGESPGESIPQGLPEQPEPSPVEAAHAPVPTEETSGGNRIWVAGFWTRFAAFSLDTLVVTSVVIAMMILSSLLLGDKATGAFLFFAQKVSTLILAILVFVTFLLIYLSLFARFGGQTAGKMLLGIRVVKLDGHSISSWQAIRRALGMLLAALPGLAGFLWTAFDLNRRGWHDHIGGTLVVHVLPHQPSSQSDS